MICPHCHADNRDGAKYCNECGSPLAAEKAQMAAPAGQTEGASEDQAAVASRNEELLDSLPPVLPSESASDPGATAHLDGARSDKAADGAGSAPAEGRPAQVELPTIKVAGVNVDAEGRSFSTEEFADGMDGVDGVDGAGGTPRPGEKASADAPKAAELSTEDFPVLDPKEVERARAKAAYEEEGEGEPLYPSIANALKDYEKQNGFGSGGSNTTARPGRSVGETADSSRSDEGTGAARRAYRAPDAQAQKKKRERRRRTLSIVIPLAIVIVVVAVLGGTYQLELWGGKTVPDVVGRTQADAVYLLEQKGFTVVTTLVKSDETEGIVLSQSPVADSKKENGSEVEIKVSSSRVIPDVVGMDRDEAVSLIEEEGILNVVVVTEESEERSGTVLSVSPSEGSRATSSTVVTVTVATPYTVPDVTGMSLDEAQEVLEDYGYTVSVSYTYDADAQVGTVAYTDPEADSVLTLGSKVTIYLAQELDDFLENAAYNYLSSLSTVTTNGTTYQIESVFGVTYKWADDNGDYVLAYTVTTSSGEWVNGTIVLSSDGAVVDVY